jgi:superfamily II DNA or RNA helicase
VAPLLSDYTFQIAYGPNDDRVNEFYVPALSRSVRYDRSAGFFSSSALAVAATGVARLIANGGKMRLLVGAQLSEADVNALQGGMELAAVVAARMASDLDKMIDAIAGERLAAVAWMIEHDSLEVRVVLPKGKDGHPLPASMCHDYYHPKTGIFTDAEGNRVVFTGSINESEQAWLHNYEMFSVYCSWAPGLLGYITTHAGYFERLWNDQEDGWIGLSIPEAVRQRLLHYSPTQAPTSDPEETGKEPEQPVKPKDGGAATADRRERIIFQFLRDAPYLPNGRMLGQVSSTVRLWPHQALVVDKVVGTYPQRYMLCDEVGLGKTLEGGAVAKQLMLSGRVRRTLILAPKSVCRQWQEELYEKFLLNVPLYDGGVFTDYFRRELPSGVDNPWNSSPIMIASSQLAKRRERVTELYQSDPWDLVLVDEAHHARRRDFLSGQYRRNRLLSLLLGPQDNPSEIGLANRTRGLVLLTATPMQVDAREVWDLLTVLGLGGRWGASDSNFMRFFDEIRKGVDADWNFLLPMVRDYLDHGGEIDPTFARAALDRVGLVAWETIKGLPYTAKARTIIAQLDEVGQAVLLEFVRRHTPLAGYIIRNTRSLLREYQKRGLLGENKVPTRKPEPAWIRMRIEESELYERIEEYISHFYKKYEAERKGLGFIMTVYRRRLTSSFFAIAKSLERRLRFLRGDPEASPFGGLTDEDIEEDDLDADVADDMAQVDQSLYREEIAYVEDFLSMIHPNSVDSKVEQLLQDLAELFQRRETVIVFTLYTDTMDYLRDKLRAVYGGAVACYSGRGGEVWDGSGWKLVTRDSIKKDFKEEKVKILLGTDALSEGLNLQTCGMMVNYDMPWNPMRVEQRIGRIDRIGQRYDEVWIRNYFYEHTVESDIYRALEGRISWFETVVGDLQPILAKVARAIKTAAMETGAARQQLLAFEIEAIKRDIDQKQINVLNLDEYLAKEVEQRKEEPPPVTQADIERLLVRSARTKDLLQPHRTIAGAYQLWNDGTAIPITFNPRLFDEHPSGLRLLSYDENLFSELIEAVEEIGENDESENPHLCNYYRSTESGIVPILTLSSLESALTQDAPPLDTTRLAGAQADFKKRLEDIKQREQELQETRRRAEEAALHESGRQLLLDATYVDLALGRYPALFDKSPNLAGFSEDAVKALKRHGYPFAPLLRLVGTEDVNPSPSDLAWVSVQDASRESLQSRFEAIKRPITDLLYKLQSMALDQS